MAVPGGPERRWPRPLALFLATLSLTVLQPILLVAVPFALLAVVAPGHRLGALALAGVVLALAFSGSPGTGLWYVERGWTLLVGGCFAAITLVWPAGDFTRRGLVAVGGGVASALGVFLLWPEGWAVTDWVVSERIVRGSLATLETFGALQGQDGLSETLMSTVERTAELQGRVFPALLALSSLSALGVAWWLHVRLSHGRNTGLGPIRSFRFPDQLVWLLIVGVLLLIWGWGEEWSRAGENVVVFMSVLYALRGIAVVVALAGGVSVVGFALATGAMILAAPLVLAGAFALGLGDTWLDLRTRFRRADADPETNGTI